jgi:hypothetical protein
MVFGIRCTGVTMVGCAAAVVSIMDNGYGNGGCVDDKIF